MLVADESAGLRVLRRLAKAGHRIAAVLTTPNRRTGAGIANVARDLGVTLLPAEEVRDPKLARRIEEWETDLLLNVHSLYVVHGEVVRAPIIGSFNLHPGPLPEYAGLNAPSWAIANGESRHAVTVHWMEAEIDTGAIAYEAAFDITETDTGLSLGLTCVERGIELIDRLLEDARAGTIPARPQELARRHYYGKEAPHGGRMRWDQPARCVVDLVRASDYGPFPSPWGRPKSALADGEIEILKAARTGKPTRVQPGIVGRVGVEGAEVAAADEWVLVTSIAVPGRTATSPVELLHEGARLDAGWAIAEP